MLTHPMAERLRDLGMAAMADAFLEMQTTSAAADLTREDLCGRPLGCKRKIENSDNRVDSGHVSGLLARQHGRWPRWDPRSSPKQARGFESRCPRRVLRIVGSTDGHLVQLSPPGIDAWIGW